MPTYIKIKIRRDTTSNWTTVNPVLELGEIGADITKYGLKVGNGTSRWTDLPFCSPELVNDLIAGGTDKALTAQQGVVLKSLVDQKIDNATLNTAIDNLRDELVAQIQSSSSGVVVENNLNSTSSINALSANSGRVLKNLVDAKADQSDLDNLRDRVDSLGLFGMGYTIDAFNEYSKPTKITFEDGVTATLNWYPGGGMLKKITASTGEVMTINYDENDRIVGRTITR